MVTLYIPFSLVNLLIVLARLLHNHIHKEFRLPKVDFLSLRVTIQMFGLEEKM